MAEEQQSVSGEQQTSEPQTLDQVYKTYNVEETASNFNPQPHQQTQPAQQTHVQSSAGTDIPDPILDQAGFKAYLANTNAEHSRARVQLTQALQQISSGEKRRQLEADIKSAVSHVREKVGTDVDEEFIEVQLDYKSRKDPRFMSLFQNRERNPAAWKAALSAVGNEMKSKNQFRSDPQLTENVRAARQSTQSSLTSRDSGDSSNPIQRQLDNAKSESERQQIWSRVRSGE